MNEIEPQGLPSALPRRYIGWAALANGIMCTGGFVIAAFMYRHASVSSVVLHLTDKVGQKSIRVESVEAYLFAVPFFQLLVFLITLSFFLFWSAYLKLTAELLADRFLQSPSQASVGYIGQCVGLVIFQVFAFSMTL